MSTDILIVPVATKEWWAAVIRFCLRRKFNHLFIAYPSETWGGWWAADIRGDGVTKVPLEKAMARVKYAEFWESSMDLTVGLKRTRKFVMAGYDTLGAIANGVKVLLWRLTGWKSLRPVHSTDKVYCEEYGAIVIRLSDIHHSEEMDPPTLWPGDVRDFMDRSIYFNEVPDPRKAA